MEPHRLTIYVKAIECLQIINDCLTSNSRISSKLIDDLILMRSQLDEVCKLQSNPHTQNVLFLQIHKLTQRIDDFVSRNQQQPGPSKKRRHVSPTVPSYPNCNQPSSSNAGAVKENNPFKPTDPIISGFRDIAGLSDTIKVLKCSVLIGLRQPQLFKSLSPSKCLLLYGPPGTGKTKIVHALAAEAQACLVCVTPGDIMNKYVGQSEKMLKMLFDNLSNVTKITILFLDELDSFCRRRSDKEAEHDRRLKTELLVQLSKCTQYNSVYIVGATNCPWDIDPAFLRRFSKRIHVPLPNRSDRAQLILLFSGESALHDTCTNPKNFNEWQSLLDSTDGFSGSDLESLVHAAQIGPIIELQDVTSWVRLEDNTFVPASQKSSSSMSLSNDELAIVTCNMDELPIGTVRCRPATIQDLLAATQSVTRTVSDCDVLRYAEYIIQNR